MKLRTKHRPPVAAAKAGLSTAGIFDEEVVPLLQQTPDLRAVTIFEELLRRHPETAAQRAPHPGTPGAPLAIAARPRSGGHLRAAPAARAAGPVGLHARASTAERAALQ